MTTELLRLCSPGVRNQERPVVRDKLLLELKSASSIEVLGVVSHNGLRDRLTDSIDLRSVSTALHAKTDVDRREGLLASNEDRLVNLEAQDLGPEKGEGGTVDVNEATSLLSVRDGSCGLVRGMRCGRFLDMAAERMCAM